GFGYDQLGGMQVEPGTATTCDPTVEALVPIAVITGDGVPRMLQMDTDLMLPPGQQSRLQKGGPAPDAPLDADVGLGALAGRVNDDPGGFAPQRRVQDLPPRRPGSRDQGDVVALDRRVTVAQPPVDTPQPTSTPPSDR